MVSSRIFIYNAGNAILAINTVSAFDTFRFLVFALLDGNINFCILAIRTGRSYEANGPRSAVLTIFSRCANNNLGHSSIEGLIHRTAGNELLAAVRFFIRGVRISNLARTNGFAPCIFIGILFIRSSIQVRTDVRRVDVGQFLDLGHVDGIRIIKAGCQIRNPAGGCRVAVNSSTNGNGTSRRFPGCRGVCGGFIGGCRNRVIAFCICFSSCRGYRAAANGYAAINGNICIMANDCGIRSSQFLILIFFLICRTDDDIVLSICQGVVITDDDIRLVLVDAVTGDAVVGADDVVIFAVSQGILEAIDIVVLSRCT